MHNLQDIQDKIFFEIKNILDSLNKIDSKDELLMKQGLFEEVADRIAFLRILDKNQSEFENIFRTAQDLSKVQDITPTPSHLLHDDLNEEDFADDIIEEEVIFTNELNNIHDENNKVQDPELSDDISLSDPLPSAVLESTTTVIEETEETHHENRIAEKEKALEESETRRREIVEFSKPNDSIPKPPVEEIKTETTETVSEKKFRLANIKSLKAMQQLFDNDPLERKDAEEKPVATGSILKTNIQTDYMEAERTKLEFKLDLNDRVAFTKSLFDNDGEELTRTIAKLNSFKTLDEAKKFLSDIYYEKDWQKKDEYAQRLWSLVENKFL